MKIMQTKYFYVAAYLRLSREDHGGHRMESNSIGSQRELIEAFVKRQDDMEIYDMYIDGSDIIGLKIV